YKGECQDKILTFFLPASYVRIPHFHALKRFVVWPTNMAISPNSDLQNPNFRGENSLCQDFIRSISGKCKSLCPAHA
ncbi:MAG: hypothetical protein ACOYJU_07895, partial [Anaerovoracaceae bacterium]